MNAPMGFTYSSLPANWHAPHSQTIFVKFLQIARACNLSFDEAEMEKVHRRIAEFTFWAYTRVRNNEVFNKIKALASDKTNVAFRTAVQTGANKDGKKSQEIFDKMDKTRFKAGNISVLWLLTRARATSSFT